MASYKEVIESISVMSPFMFCPRSKAHSSGTQDNLMCPVTNSSGMTSSWKCYEACVCHIVTNCHIKAQCEKNILFVC